MTGFAYAACGMVLLGCAAYAASAWHDRGQPWLLVRARWAWRCRGRPVPGDGEKLTRAEIQVLGNLDAGRDVRSGT